MGSGDDRAARVRRVNPLVARALSFLGCALTLQATPAAAQTRRPVPPSRTVRHAAPPWSEARGTQSVPLARARVSSIPLRPVDHPAVHRTRQAPPHRLFPRLAEVQEQRQARAESMRKHPAGKGARVGQDTRAAVRTSSPGQEMGGGESTRSTNGWNQAEAEHQTSPMKAIPDRRRQQPGTIPSRSYRVRAGDTLWDIAARADAGADAQRTRTLTMQLYRYNRDVIGPNPNLILPGQVLRLPFDLER